MASLVSQRIQSIELQQLLSREINSPSISCVTTMQAESLTDSQKLDRLLAGFQGLQAQYKEIKEDHDILRDECKTLKEENKRLKQTLLSMTNVSGKDYLKCEDLLQEIVDLKEAVSNGRDELEEYKRMLEESNGNLKTALDALKSERAKKCNCFICRLITWTGLKK